MPCGLAERPSLSVGHLRRAQNFYWGWEPCRLGCRAGVLLSWCGHSLQGLGTTQCHVHFLSGAGEAQTDQECFHLGQKVSSGWSNPLT